SESAWSSTGGGQSRFETRPSYQTDYFNSGGLTNVSSAVLNSGKRLTPDVAYDANPSTGFAVFDSTPSGGLKGWLVFGGTSAGAPQWAALVAIADQGRLQQSLPMLATSDVLGTLYNPSTYATNFHDVTTGGPRKLKAGTGYDLSTGLGSP